MRGNINAKLYPYSLTASFKNMLYNITLFNSINYIALHNNYNKIVLSLYISRCNKYSKNVCIHTQRVKDF